MADRPILFSASMVQALLAGRKTQTRRVVKWRGMEPGLNLQFSGLSVERSGSNFVLSSPTRDSHAYRSVPQPCPYGQPGDRLWVRETFAPLTVGYAYAADPIWNAAPDGRWRPSIHMPRAASRITLEITEVRVERLHVIGEMDSAAEGVELSAVEGFARCGVDRPAAFAFRDLWININGADSWEANPWVWAVSFRLLAPNT